VNTAEPKTVPSNLSWKARVGSRIDRFVTPTSEDLPNLRVLLVFPALLLIALVILVGLGITGSSSGILNQYFSNKSDPALIAGRPEAIRSDEWMVQTPLVISQVEQGLPVDNHNLPGGVDSTVQSDLPSRDWSVAFRPHLLGFLFLSLNSAMSLRWWLPGFALIAACYLFFVSLSPRRPFTAAVIATGFFFSPFFQWWYLPITFWPVAWAFLVMACAVWLLRSRRLAPRIVLLALVAYVTVTTAVGVYVPFMIPALLAAAAFVIGLVLRPIAGEEDVRLGGRIKRMLPLVGAGAVGGLIVGIWVLTRLGTIQRFLGTIYPGQRLTPPGTVTPRGILSLLAAPFSRSLGASTGPPLDNNPSEASSFLLIGIILFVPLIWMVWRRWRDGGRVDWLVVSLAIFLVVVVAYLVLPGWGIISNALLLDRTTAPRVRPAFGILAIVVTAVYVQYVDSRRESGRAVSWWLVAAAACVAGLWTLGVAIVLRVEHEPFIWETAIPVCFAVVLSTALLTRGRFLLGGLAILLISLFVGGTVNPVYVGVYDLNKTTLVHYMKSLKSSKTDEWVGVGATLPNVILEQSGLHSYNGFQSAPPPAMWAQIDPSKRYEQVWNRLASVGWVDGAGDPKPRNPEPDSVTMIFDSCAPFAQAHVNYVLSDAPLTSTCATLLRAVAEGPSTFWVYKVKRT
jgi:hypothetical protein